MIVSLMERSDSHPLRGIDEARRDVVRVLDALNQLEQQQLSCSLAAK